MIEMTGKGNFANLLLETLLKEKGTVRVRGYGRNHKESIPLGWAMDSIQKVSEVETLRGGR